MALFSKRHYEFLECALRAPVAESANYGPGYQSATRDLIHDLATALAADNPQFDRERFLTACGLSVEPRQ